MHWLDACQNRAAAFQLTAGIRRRIEIERRGLLPPHRLPGPQGLLNSLGREKIVCA